MYCDLRCLAEIAYCRCLGTEGLQGVLCCLPRMALSWKYTDCSLQVHRRVHVWFIIKSNIIHCVIIVTVVILKKVQLCICTSLHVQASIYYLSNYLTHYFTKKLCFLYTSNGICRLDTFPVMYCVNIIQIPTVNMVQQNTKLATWSQRSHHLCYHMVIGKGHNNEHFCLRKKEKANIILNTNNRDKTLAYKHDKSHTRFSGQWHCYMNTKKTEATPGKSGYCKFLPSLPSAVNSVHPCISLISHSLMHTFGIKTLTRTKFAWLYKNQHTVTHNVERWGSNLKKKKKKKETHTFTGTTFNFLLLFFFSFDTKG